MNEVASVGLKRSGLWAGFLLAASITALLTCTTIGSAFGQHPIGLVRVDVSAATGSHSPRARAAARLPTAVTHEVRALEDFAMADPDEQADWVVRPSITQISQRRVGDATEVQCAVSVIVSDARTESVQMLLNGRAGARAGSHRRDLEQAAVSAAVRNALRGLSELESR